MATKPRQSRPQSCSAWTTSSDSRLAMKFEALSGLGFSEIYDKYNHKNMLKIA